MRFSLTVFCYSQGLTDLESLYFLVHQEYPVHRFFHTFLGATFGAVLCAVSGKFVCQVVLRIGERAAPQLFRALVGTSARIRWSAAFVSAFVGTYSHVLLDGIMHPDVQPFAPFTNSNPFYHLIDVGLLHMLCVLAAVVGFACLITVSRPPESRK